MVSFSAAYEQLCLEWLFKAIPILQGNRSKNTYHLSSAIYIPIIIYYCKQAVTPTLPWDTKVKQLADTILTNWNYYYYSVNAYPLSG